MTYFVNHLRGVELKIFVFNQRLIQGDLELDHNNHLKIHILMWGNPEM